MIWDTKSIIIISITLANLIVLITIKCNDFKHLEKDVLDLRNDFKLYLKKLYSLAQRVSRNEGKLSKK